MNLYGLFKNQSRITTPLGVERCTATMPDWSGHEMRRTEVFMRPGVSGAGSAA